MADKINPTPISETPVVSQPTLSADELSNVKIQPQVLREVILALQANLHHSTANTKRRGEVRGGGKKPWRQKGTGRARTGSSRNPLWRGGGITFGPLKTKNYQQNITTALRRQALLAALKLKLQAGKVSLVQLDPQVSKTKVAAKQLSTATSLASALIVTSNPAQAKPLHNIAGLKIATINRVNALDIASARQIIFLNHSFSDLKTKLGV